MKPYQTIVVALLCCGAVALCALAADDEGVDLTRRITSRVKPNIMLAFDRSGSMGWPLESESTTFGFQLTDAWGIVHQGDPQVGYDYSQTRSYGPYYRSDSRAYPNRGGGHGYWLKLDRSIDWDHLNVVYQGSERTGTIDLVHLDRIRLSPGPGIDLGSGDLVFIWDYSGYPEVAGLYEIYSITFDTTPYIRVRRIREDGIRDSSSLYSFPTAGASLKIHRVRIGVYDPSDPEPREAAMTGLYDTDYPNNLYVLGEPVLYRGDLIRVTGMPNAAENGLYLVQSLPTASSINLGYSAFRVSATDADGTWDWNDPDYTFSSATDSPIQVQRVMPVSRPLPDGAVWYWVPSSRMAIAKNVLGSSLRVYQPDDSLEPAGYDDLGVPYYVFAPGDPAPDSGSGAYYNWYLKVWQGWSEAAPENEPIAEPLVTSVHEPAGVVRRTSDIVNWGLLSFAGNCDGQDLEVQVNPDDEDQQASIDAIEEHLDVVPNGGLWPSGNTPTRDALATARSALLTDPVSTWSQDPLRTCDRVYGVILMTDGLSNNCNPDNYEWDSCPVNWEDYPPGVSEQLWQGEDDSGTFLTNVRTWVVGLSPLLAGCELNYTAYRGRTDASSPNGDVGFATEDDPRLPEGVPGSFDSSADYAFLTSSPEELAAAYKSIVTSMHRGSYATTAPVVATNLGATAVGFLGATDARTWAGHLLAVDPDGSSVLWDAAEVLGDSMNPNAGVPRRIYTWDPQSSYELIEIESSNLVQLDDLCGGCGVTEDVIRFVRGYDPGDTLRELQLGALLNSTPTVVAGPEHWEPSSLSDHTGFEAYYASRHGLVWVGTSDGTVRAFDSEDGAEILCLIPPELLDHQVALAQQYLVDPLAYPLGQSKLPSEHRYGIASSLLAADVYDKSIASYRTMMYLSEGPGGTGLHAVDVTHPYSRVIDGILHQDPDYGYGIPDGPPVKVLWSRTADGEAGTGVIPDMGLSWSTPAIAPVRPDSWRLQVGAGYIDNPDNTRSPRVYHLDPLTAALGPGGYTMSCPELANAPSYWVTNQAFADSALWQRLGVVSPFNATTLEGVQADLNGHLWRLTQHTRYIIAEPLVSLDEPEPIYFGPAVARYPEATSEYTVYAYSSGSALESSSTITGPAVGTTGSFIPKLYLTVRELSSGEVTTVGVPTGDLPDGSGWYMGPRTQATAPAMLFMPFATDLPFALFLFHDPDATLCAGASYLVRVSFDVTEPEAILDDLDSAVDIFEAGEGMVGGFVVHAGRVLVARSAPDGSGPVQLVEVPGLSVP